MATTDLTDVDIKLRNAVVRQLDWDPEVDASAVGITAKGGVVTLTGFIDTYAGKLAAERAAKHVRGVRAVANDIGVRLRMEKNDSEIASEAARALALRDLIPEGVQAVVHQGNVTLTGKVSWNYQKISAEDAVRHVRGVRGVHNYIDIIPRAAERDVRHRIVEALHRNADLDAHHIEITITGAVAMLTGHVETWLQRDAAERATASAPGIAYVDNRIAVEPTRDVEADVADEIC